jgi:hypothetical protein
MADPYGDDPDPTPSPSLPPPLAPLRGGGRSLAPLGNNNNGALAPSSPSSLSSLLARPTLVPLGRPPLPLASDIPSSSSSTTGDTKPRRKTDANSRRRNRPQAPPTNDTPTLPPPPQPIVDNDPYNSTPSSSAAVPTGGGSAGTAANAAATDGLLRTLLAQSGRSPSPLPSIGDDHDPYSTRGAGPTVIVTPPAPIGSTSPEMKQLRSSGHSVPSTARSTNANTANEAVAYDDGYDEDDEEYEEYEDEEAALGIGNDESRRDMKLIRRSKRGGQRQPPQRRRPIPVNADGTERLTGANVELAAHMAAVARAQAAMMAERKRREADELEIERERIRRQGGRDVMHHGEQEDDGTNRCASCWACWDRTKELPCIGSFPFVHIPLSFPRCHIHICP